MVKSPSCRDRPGRTAPTGTHVSNGGASPKVMIAGYSVIEAANLEEAAVPAPRHRTGARRFKIAPSRANPAQVPPGSNS